MLDILSQDVYGNEQLHYIIPFFHWRIPKKYFVL